MSDFLVIFSSVCMHAISVARDRIDLQVPGSRRRIMNEDEEEYDGLSLTLAIIIGIINYAKTMMMMNEMMTSTSSPTGKAPRRCLSHRVPAVSYCKLLPTGHVRLFR